MTVLATALGACQERETGTGPGEMSVGEARALEDAASMLDESRVPENPLGEEPPEDGTAPAP